MFENFWHKKEKPFAGFGGFGGGVSNLALASSGLAPQIEASGGHIHDYTDPAGDVYRYHVFVAPGAFVISDLGDSDGNIEYLLVAGGGTGGTLYYGGGGGAGGMQQNFPAPAVVANGLCTTPSLTLAAGTYPVAIGYGGRNSSEGNNDPYFNKRGGGDSVFGFPSTITANGGGQGGGRQGSPKGARYGADGGCGGGGAVAVEYPQIPQTWLPRPAYSPGATTGSQGYGGGALANGNPVESVMGTGGGGLGAIGGARANQPPFTKPANADAGAVGGDGARITDGGIMQMGIGTPGPNPGIYIGGGGGGGTGAGYSYKIEGEPGYARYPGGAGGGGDGSTGGGSKGNLINRPDLYGPQAGYSETNASNFGTQPQSPNDPGNPMPVAYSPGGGQGLDMTGSGGGGGGFEGGGFSGGNGAPGVGIIKYLIGPKQTGSAKATGGLVTFTGTHTIHTFLQPGTFVTPAPFSETCEYVVLGGGGGGGGGKNNAAEGVGGGGGAGGYLTNTTPVGGSLSLTVTVGMGGNGGRDASGFWWYTPTDYPNQSYLNYQQLSTTPGGNSVVNFPAGTVTAIGGGAGGDKWGNTTSPSRNPIAPNYTRTSTSSEIGDPGGSGGGCAQETPQTPEPFNSGGLGNQWIVGGAPYPGQGYAGGYSYYYSGDPSMGGGGGGGAGGVGGNSSQADGRNNNNVSGPGGNGVRLPTTFRDPKALYYPGPLGNWYVAGGGAGGAVLGPHGSPGNPTRGNPGYGGGGKANDYPSYPPPSNPGPQQPTWSPYLWCNPEANGKMGSGSGGGGGCFAEYDPTNNQGSGSLGGNGGSGLVMIAYPT